MVVTSFAEFAHLPSDRDDGAWDELAETLAQLPPGPELAALLVACEYLDTGDYFLVEMAAAYQRLAAWSHARLAAVGRELAERPPFTATGAPRSSPPSRDLAGDELAPRLGLSRRAARHIVRDGWAFTKEFEATGQALEEGRIDAAKARTIVNHLKDVPGAIAFAVQLEVLPTAGTATLSQLVRNIQRALIAVDPDEATARHRRARSGRRVDHPRPLPHGMASMYAVLTATDAASLDLALEAAARTAKRNGDNRSVDQLRADALSLFGHTALGTGCIGCPPQHPEHPAGHHRGAPARPDAHPPDLVGPAAEHLRLGQIGGRPAQVRVTVPLDVLLPSELAADRLAITTTSRGGPSARVAPAAPVPSPLPSRGRTVPNGDADPPDAAADATDELDGVPRCLALPPAEVAELHGYGPITPDVARALAVGGTWQRLVIDPGSGALRDVGRQRYRPPPELATFVRERDDTCVRPGCSSPAQGCELDHIVPWLAGGPTSVDNLAALCPADHAIKTLGAFQLRPLGDGAFEWRTPTGHVYHRDARGTVTRRPGGHHQGRRHRAPASAPGHIGTATARDAAAATGPVIAAEELAPTAPWLHRLQAAGASSFPDDPPF